MLAHAFLILHARSRPQFDISGFLQQVVEASSGALLADLGYSLFRPIWPEGTAVGQKKQGAGHDDGASTWAVVLAGGDGKRLQSMTRNAHGIAVPKQYCSLLGGPCLLEGALRRALEVAPAHRVGMVVAAQHREWWEGLQTELPPENLIVQPHNRGTAHGILLPLLEILARDRDARVVLLPADQFVDDEAILAVALRRAANLARDNDRAIYLLGIEPDAPDTEYGYIVPAEPPSTDQPSQVLEFVENPSHARAKALIAQGAVWNAFIMAASAWAFLRLFAGSFSSTIVALSQIAERRIHLHGKAFDRLYEQLPTVDFSKDVLPGHEEVFQVLPVSPCGWNDLGTPHRIARTLQHLRDDWSVSHLPLRKSTYLSLAEQSGHASKGSLAMRAV